MSDVAKALRERRAQAWEQAKAVADKAATEGRALTVEEQTAWDGLNQELTSLDQRIAAVVEGERRAADIDASLRALDGRPVERRPGTPEGGSSEVLEGIRSFLKGETRAYEVPVPASVDLRTLSKLSAGAGANTVPTDFYNGFVEYLVDSAQIMGAGVTVINTTGGEELTIPKATAHSTAALTAEAAALGASDPTFGANVLRAYKYGVLVQVSTELIDDTGFDLEGYIARQAGRAVGNAVGAHLVNGDGTSKPAGILLDATNGVTGAAGSAAGGPTADNLIDLLYSVIAPYRNARSAAFLTSDSGMARLRKIKDTTGQYLFQPALTAGTPDTLLGKPIFTDPSVPTGASAKQAAFGDMSAYFVRIAGGVRFERSNEYAFANDLVTFRCVLRADGKLTDPNAVKTFTAAAT